MPLILDSRHRDPKKGNVQAVFQRCGPGEGGYVISGSWAVPLVRIAITVLEGKKAGTSEVKAPPLYSEGLLEKGKGHNLFLHQKGTGKAGKVVEKIIWGTAVLDWGCEEKCGSSS